MWMALFLYHGLQERGLAMTVICLGCVMTPELGKSFWSPISRLPILRLHTLHTRYMRFHIFFRKGRVHAGLTGGGVA